jgi:hypothetical protein
MKKLPMPIVMALSPLLVCAAAGIAYLAIYPIHPDFAKVVAGVILSSLAKVYSYLKDKEIKLNFLKAVEVDDAVRQYTLKWYVMIIYGFLVMMGIISLYAGAGGVISEIILGGPVGVIMFTLFIGITITPVLFFYFGAWVGKKSNKHKILTIFITVLLMTAVDYLSIILVPESSIQRIANQTKSEFLQEWFSITTILWRVLFTSVYMLIALLGCRRGENKRLVTQLQDLFRVLPTDIQNTVVELVYEEATKLSRDQVAPQAVAPQVGA